MKAERSSEIWTCNDSLQCRAVDADSCKEESTATTGDSVFEETLEGTTRLVSATERIMDGFRKATTLALLVRLSGAAIIVLALSLFLMQGVDASNDLQRYHLLLLQTSLLGVAGFAVGYLLKEPRGARVFFSLGLVSIPANLAVLGAMVYSIMPSGHLSAHYPDYANWQASSLSDITIALVTGLIVLVPMALFAFSVLARQSRVWLTCGYLFSSSMLLLPVRDSITVAIISTLVAACMVVLIKHRARERADTLTAEQWLTRILLFLPPVLMIARSAVLYSGDFPIALTVVAITYILLRQWSGQCTKVAFWSNTLHVISTLTAIFLAGLSSTLFAGSGSLPGSAPLVFTLILAGLLLDLSRYVGSRSIRWWMHTGWAILCIPAFFGNLIFWAGASAFVLSLLVSTLMTGSGFAFRNRLVIFLGVVSLAGNVLVQGNQVVHMIMSSNWMSVAMTGAAVVVCGSLIERYGVVLKLKVNAFATRHQAQGRTPDLQPDIEGADAKLPDEANRNLAA